MEMSPEQAEQFERAQRVAMGMVRMLLAEYGAMNNPGDFQSLMSSISILQYEIVEAAILSGVSPLRLKEALRKCYETIAAVCDNAAALTDKLAMLRTPPKSEQN